MNETVLHRIAKEYLRGYARRTYFYLVTFGGPDGFTPLGYICDYGRGLRSLDENVAALREDGRAHFVIIKGSLCA